MSRKNKILTVVLMCICLMVGSITVNAENYTSVTQPTSYGKFNSGMFIEDNALSSKYPYMVQIATHNVYENGLDMYDYYYTVYSETEIVIYKENDKYYTLSLSFSEGDYKSLFWFNIEEVNSNDYLQISSLDCAWTAGNGMSVCYGSTSYTSTCMYNSTYIFDGYDTAMAYLKTGSMTGLLENPSKKYDSENIYLDNFHIEVYDSNVLEEFYIDFYYEPSPQLKDNVDNGYIEFSYDYDIDYDILAGLIDGEPIQVKSSSFVIDLSSFPNFYRWYPSNSFEITNGLEFIVDMKRFKEGLILGDECVFDADALSFEGIGGNTFTEVTKSRCTISLIPYIDNTMGLSSNCSIDFLKPDKSHTSTSTPNSDGDYVSNNDYKVSDGYYYTEVGQDAHGNNTYNYYYITDNSKTEIDGSSGGGSSGSGVNVEQNNNVSIPDSITVNVNNGSGGDINIDDDDYSADSLNQLIDGGAGIFDNLDTEKNDDGFLSMLTNFFGGIDDDLAGALGFGMGSTILVCILRSIFRR